VLNHQVGRTVKRTLWHMVSNIDRKFNKYGREWPCTLYQAYYSDKMLIKKLALFGCFLMCTPLLVHSMMEQLGHVSPFTVLRIERKEFYITSTFISLTLQSYI
jgi:hypothetical protein